jgi:hypothetical protein
MSVRLLLLERHLPDSLRRRMFRDLVGLTAEAFGVPAPAVHRLPRAEGIAEFARFTRGEAARALGDPSRSSAVRSRLFKGAQEMGSRARSLLGIREQAEAVRALSVLYGAIGIELDADLRNGEIVVTNCAFSRFYTPEVCEFISVLDAGIVSGLTNGTSLVFTERITEGAPCCRARLAGGVHP